MDNALAGIVTVATAIVGVAILAVLVSKNAQTPQVIQAFTQGFGADLTAAEGPVSGNSFSSIPTTTFA
jgi:hypothetical protein